MAPSNPLRSGALVLLLSLASVCTANAGEKLDLTPYIGGLPAQGDFKIFDISDGGRRTSTIVGVTPHGKGWRVITHVAVEGAGASTGIFESFLVPGRQWFSGNESLDFGTYTLAILVKKPAKGLRLVGAFGKAQHSRKRGLLQLNGSPIGTAYRAGSWWADWIEPVATPHAQYASALRATHFHGLNLYDGYLDIVYLWFETTWSVAGIGLVRKDVRSEYYENGALVGTDGWQEWFVGGVIDGIPVAATGSPATGGEQLFSDRPAATGGGVARAATRLLPRPSDGWSPF
jgi:hypothetical protein